MILRQNELDRLSVVSENIDSDDRPVELWIRAFNCFVVHMSLVLQRVETRENEIKQSVQILR